MKGNIKYSEDEKIKICNEAKELGNIVLTAKKYGVNDSTIHEWMKKYSINKNQRISKSDAKEIKRLKKLLADKELECAVLKDLVKKTLQVWTTEERSPMNISPNVLLNQKY